MGENLEFVKKREANEEMIIDIYDMCNDKKEYKKFMTFCKDAGKEFRSLLKVKDTKIYQVKEIQINDNTSVTATILNFRPDTYEKQKNPLEIIIRISNDSKKGFTAHGSAIYGGCNEAEYNELIGLISSGYADFTKEF